MPRKTRFKPDMNAAIEQAKANPGKAFRADFHTWIVTDGEWLFSIERQYIGSREYWAVMSTGGPELRPFHQAHPFHLMESARIYIATGRAVRDLKERLSHEQE